MAIGVSVVILTFESEHTIEEALRDALTVSDDVHVVDSFSSDGTEARVRAAGAYFWQHEFRNYGAQRNWAIENLPLRHEWQLHLDSDDRLSPNLVAHLQGLTSSSVEGVDGFLIPRLTIFLGRPLRHGGLYPIWHCRLFRRGKGHCEDRIYDQHFFVEGRTKSINAPIHDELNLSLAEWSAKHIRWSVAEVNEVLSSESIGRIRGKLTGNPIERKRHLKGIYYRLPMLARPFIFFLYRYVVRGGFLDGPEGLIYCVLQTFWFRFLVDAQIFERRHKAADARRDCVGGV